MSSFLNFLFAIILVIIWIIAGGYITKATIDIHPYENLDNDFKKARQYTYWGAFITWTLIGIFILLVLLSVLGVVALFGSGAGEAEAAEEAEAKETSKLSSYSKNFAGKKGTSWETIGFLVFALILVSISGVLAALSASSLGKSSNFDNTNSKMRSAYHSCVVAAILCLGAAGILIIGIIVYFIVGEKRKKEVQEQEELIAEKKTQSRYK